MPVPGLHVLTWTLPHAEFLVCNGVDEINVLCSSAHHSLIEK